MLQEAIRAFPVSIFFKVFKPKIGNGGSGKQWPADALAGIPALLPCIGHFATLNRGTKALFKPKEKTHIT